jgi:Asp-tRNA(Asn)/Glu-tRNA(Gln) amidotransferase A subunit family amidase
VVAGDPDSAPFPLGTGRRPRRVVVAERTSPLGPLPAAVADAFHAASTAMAEVLGAEQVVLEHHDLFADLGDPDLDWFVLAPAEHVNALGRAFVEDNLDAMHPATAEFLRHGLTIGVDDYLAARRRRTLYARRLDELLGEDTVLLTPTVAVDTWFADGRTEADGPVGMTPPSAFSTAVQNVTGHPAVSVPAGRHASGLPFGLQVTGARWSDVSLLDVAELWEQAHPWARTAPGYDEFRVG